MRNTERDINFTVQGSTVTVDIQTDLPQAYTNNTTRYDKTCHFTLDCNSDVEAELLLRYLRKRHRKAIQNVRRKEFFAGWKHAIAKKHGKKWFGYFSDTLANQASSD